MRMSTNKGEAPQEELAMLSRHESTSIIRAKKDTSEAKPSSITDTTTNSTGSIEDAFSGWDNTSADEDPTQTGVITYSAGESSDLYSEGPGDMYSAMGDPESWDNMSSGYRQ